MCILFCFNEFVCVNNRFNGLKTRVFLLFLGIAWLCAK